MRKHKNPSPAGVDEAGVDEAGRGALAGPVIAAAVILDAAQPIAGLRDSKMLVAQTRQRLSTQILQRAHVGIGMADEEEIFAHNILQATLLAMQRALLALPVRLSLAYIDGLHTPIDAPCPCFALIRGDTLRADIAAASIIAKTCRDAIMSLADPAFPAFGFGKHKGYGTPAHLRMLIKHGTSNWHRRHFAPVRAACKGSIAFPPMRQCFDKAQKILDRSEAMPQKGERSFSS